MSNKQKSVALINTTAPFASSAGKDSLDIALILGSYEQNVDIFFINDGVFQLPLNQQPETIFVKNYLKTIPALEFYDIENLFVCQQSLTDRNLSVDSLVENTQVIDTNNIAAKLASYDVVLTF